MAAPPVLLVRHTTVLARACAWIFSEITAAHATDSVVLRMVSVSIPALRIHAGMGHVELILTIHSSLLASAWPRIWVPCVTRRTYHVMFSLDTTCLLVAPSQHPRFVGRVCVIMRE